MAFRPTPAAAVGAALAAHVAAPDPHPTYATDTALTAEMAAHVAAADPHTGYQREGQTIAGPVGFYGAAPIAKPAVTGSRGANAALASLLTQLAALGLITDSST